MAHPERALTSRDSWEAVLAAVEADVHRTQRLLTPAVAITPPAPSLAPAELMLPQSDEPVLPAFDDMPPVPPELVERITDLRARIVELQADLERCLAAARRSDRRPTRPQLAAPTVEQPHFVDRRA